MTTHKLKTWTEHFHLVKSGKKKFELRINDRDYQVGDRLILREYSPHLEYYSGDLVECEVTHILNGGCFGLNIDYVIMSIQLL